MGPVGGLDGPLLLPLQCRLELTGFHREPDLEAAVNLDLLGSKHNVGQQGQPGVWITGCSKKPGVTKVYVWGWQDVCGDHRGQPSLRLIEISTRHCTPVGERESGGIGHGPEQGGAGAVASVVVLEPGHLPDRLPIAEALHPADEGMRGRDFGGHLEGHGEKLRGIGPLLDQAFQLCSSLGRVTFLKQNSD